MAKFHIQPHGRLQEWVAHENGYFRDEGLDYQFSIPADSLARREKGASEIRSGAFESYAENQGHKGPVRSDVSCACHWTVNQTDHQGIAHLYRNAYVVTPGAVMVRADSEIRSPEDLANVGIAVGYHSGSHFTTIQSLETFLEPAAINLKFIGTPMKRLDAVLDGDIEAVSAWGLSYLIAEQLGFRRILDCSFMIGFVFPDSSDLEDVECYMRGLKRAQMEIDLRPEKYKHYYLNEMPERFQALVDVRRFGPGERIVFLPYTDEMYQATQAWLSERDLFQSAA
jgi:hypothetical protein